MVKFCNDMRKISETPRGSGGFSNCFSMDSCYVKINGGQSVDKQTVSGYHSG